MRRLLGVAIALAAGALTAQPGPSTLASGHPGWEGGQLGSAIVPSLEDAVGMIAYTGTIPGRQRSEIYTIRTDGSQRRQLTTAGGFDPAWSPDGSQLAFARRDSIWLMDASGGSQRRVAVGSEPAWSPDGTRLSYVCHDRRICVSLTCRATSETVVVASTIDWPFPAVRRGPPTEAGSRSPDTAPRGRLHRFRQLFRVHPGWCRGSLRIPNTYPEADRSGVVPDGETILYTERYDGRGGEFSGDLFLVRPDGTEKTQVTRPVRNRPGAFMVARRATDRSLE